MATIDQLEGQIGLHERSQHFQIGIILQIRQLHGERIVRTRTNIQEEEGMEPDDLLCSRNARPQKALLGRAQWKINQPPSLKRQRASLEGSFISFDARNRGSTRLPWRMERGLEERAQSETNPSAP